jgi:hypothetical protein
MHRHRNRQIHRGVRKAVTAHAGLAGVGHDKGVLKDDAASVSPSNKPAVDAINDKLQSVGTPRVREDAGSLLAAHIVTPQ